MRLTGRPSASQPAANAISAKPAPGITGRPWTMWSASQGCSSSPTSDCQTWPLPDGNSTCMPSSGCAPVNSRPAERSTIQYEECSHGVGGTSTTLAALTSGCAWPLAGGRSRGQLGVEGQRFGVVTVHRRADVEFALLDVRAPRVSVIAWVSSGCGLISTKLLCSAPASATA